MVAPNDVNIEVSASNATGEAFAAAKQGMRDLAGEAARENVAIRESFRETLGEIRGSFGRGSEFGQFFGILRGAGPIIGLKYAAEEMAHVAEGAEKAATAMREGGEDSSKMADEFARSLPILGEIYATGRSIREIFTAENAEAELQKRLADEQNDAIEFRGKLLNDELNSRKAIADFIAHEDTKANDLGLSDRGARDAGRMEDQADRRNKLTGGIDADREKEHASIVEKEHRLNAEIESLKDDIRTQAGSVLHAATHNAAWSEEEKTLQTKVEQLKDLSNQLKVLQHIDADSASRVGGDKQAALDADARLASAEKRKWADEDAAAERKSAEEQITAEGKKNDAILDAAARLHESQLRMEGEFLEAEKVRIEREREKEIQAAGEKYAGNFGDVVQFTLEMAAAEAEAEDKLREARDEDQRKRDEDLKQRQGLVSDYISGLNALGGDSHTTRSSGLARAENAGLLTGVAEQSQARRSDDPAFKEAQKQTKNTDDLVKGMTAIVALMTGTTAI